MKIGIIHKRNKSIIKIADFVNRRITGDVQYNGKGEINIVQLRKIL